MDKYLTYSVVERKDPNTPDIEGKYYAQAQARGEAGIRELSQRIQQSCTVTRADVMAVLIALEDVVGLPCQWRDSPFRRTRLTPGQPARQRRDFTRRISRRSDRERKNHFP